MNYIVGNHFVCNYSVPDTFRKGGKSGALGENNVTKRELCNENRSFLSILVASRSAGIATRFSKKRCF